MMALFDDNPITYGRTTVLIAVYVSLFILLIIIMIVLKYKLNLWTTQPLLPPPVLIPMTRTQRRRGTQRPIIHPPPLDSRTQLM
jgi:hypothetical protein